MLKKGTAKITAISRNNKSIKKTVTIKVKNIKPKAVKLNRKTATLALGGKVTLKATLSPTGVYDKGITFKTSSKSVAQVTSKGVVTAKKTGKATISAVSKEGSKKSKVYNFCSIIPFHAERCKQNGEGIRQGRRLCI